MPLEIRRKLSLSALAMVLVLPGQVLAYTDLPGVQTPEEIEARQSRVCEQVLVRRNKWAEPTNGPRYTYAYSCRQGGLSILSNQPPPSLERQKRGLNY
ncbi:hypothetical protein [Pararhizobium antarcticum]|uniref:Uncharacterized protein n=1 Tax=Pararhizobium antarcticum TaxID=1798805 RepID=A0A657LR87_9HYPH|nr:hypothetical protein [Pararhizobium antarcticum]OJF95086.1 hypothetical protein AX760_04485 [Pararhizobium antarcticum]OJF98092.1 hypothetical protein AX761_12805 [Rhizobium sp. 58]